MKTIEIAGAAIVTRGPLWPRSHSTAPTSIAPVDTAFIKR
jgi:hypothetical protein